MGEFQDLRIRKCPFLKLFNHTMDMPHIFSLLHGNDDLNYLTNHLLGQNCWKVECQTWTLYNNMIYLKNHLIIYGIDTRWNIFM
jgi:hypothetical protein